MVYTILITIVFIAEIIITITIIQSLIKFDRLIIELNNSLSQSKDGISDVCKFSTKITKQWVILSNMFVDDIKKNSESIALKALTKFLISVLAIKLNFKLVNRIRKSRISKILIKGYSFVENML